MHWVIASPFVKQPQTTGWLTPFVPAGSRHTFSFVPAPPSKNWHHRKTRATGLDEWKSYWKQGKTAWHEAAHGADRGVITLFPQLAACVGLRKRLTISRTPVVA